ncbi:OmpW/AlkL family protein [Marinobacter sp. SS21]|uniref:OmpW/AlkL family protein n=1 Tax=Marinobacter sp. SS21 TaxID=2979460 RepID=UPI00232C510F|nr:OmpW family outer membrane protein [Marinobacter sp. SS21]MDC0661416.1 outer membrane beta-barrel protein [Marinobacter sp. SS21]
MKKLPLALAMAFPFVGVPALAGEADTDTDHIVRIGYADIRFNVDSGELAGPPGTTPPGVTVAVRDTATLALVYEYRLSKAWSLVAQAGTPPTIEMEGDGAAAALGKVGSVKAWFPALLIAYNFDFHWIKPYVGAGLNYTWFSEEAVTPAYTRAFGGTASDAELEDAAGAVVKLGAEFPLADRWSAGVSYSRYWVSTTAEVTTHTPGLGDVRRSIDVDADPDVFSVTLGYHF